MVDKSADKNNDPSKNSPAGEKSSESEPRTTRMYSRSMFFPGSQSYLGGSLNLHDSKGFFTRLTKILLWNPYLKAVRNGLTLTLPLVMAGCFAVLIANFPLQGYQSFMLSVFGENWRLLSVHIAGGTFSILAMVMLLTISFSLAEHYNSIRNNREMHPTVVALISLACLVVLVQPYSLTGNGSPPGQGLPLFWLGVHGLFLAIIVAFISTWLFFRLKRLSWLNVSFYSEGDDVSIVYAFSAMLPGMITIVAFALLKVLLQSLGVESVHQVFYEVLASPFAQMGNTFVTAVFYTFIRHFFWFFGIHGTNLMEPVTVAIYVPAMQANLAAVADGLPPPFIFTKTFFDVFIALGGSGSTLCLLLAVIICNRRGSIYKITQISFLPAVFNINEMVIFGLPIVLNPIFFIPFLLVPIAQVVITYATMSWGLVPYTIFEIDWTTPVFISGYAATGSYAGALLQLVNLLVGCLLYFPFIRIAEGVKQTAFKQAMRELVSEKAGGGASTETDATGETLALSRSLASDLEVAIKREEISLEYQPQVDSLTGKVFGVEALMRWDNALVGRIPPVLFIALAEDTGIIKSLGNWALEESCRQWDEWRRAGFGDVVMSVNLSVKQLEEGILQEIDSRLKRYNIPPGKLEVEVTESVALAGTNHSDLLHRIHDLGVSLAIDDFGMGHSSLVYLKQFPVDTIKIDQVLSKDVATSRHSAEIISTISELCTSLHIHSLVEYVDHVEQLKVLQDLGCNRIQGWLYSKSLPPDKCLEFIRRGAPIY